LKSATGGSNVIFTDVEILNVRSQAQQELRSKKMDKLEKDTQQYETKSVIEQRVRII
jgi:hypothetical protein